MSDVKTNEFTLKIKGVTKMTFDVTNHSITHDKGWEGIQSIKCTPTGCTFIIKASRHHSPDVAGWFKTKVDSGHAIGTNTIDGMPSELNFAFMGNMTFDYEGTTYSGKDIVIAQGHSGFRNNWWLGGPHMKGKSIPAVAAAEVQLFKKNGLPVSPVIFSTLLKLSVSEMDMRIENVQ